MPADRLSVFLVDDDKFALESLRQTLPDFDIEVDAFSDPREALANFKPGRYSLCMIDIRMPWMSGFELARWIWRRDEATQVCFMTEFEINRSEAEMMFPSLKQSCFVKKPITASEMAAHLRKHYVPA